MKCNYKNIYMFGHFWNYDCGWSIHLNISIFLVQLVSWVCWFELLTSREVVHANYCMAGLFSFRQEKVSSFFLWKMRRTTSSRKLIFSEVWRDLIEEIDDSHYISLDDNGKGQGLQQISTFCNPSLIVFILLGTWLTIFSQCFVNLHK